MSYQETLDSVRALSEGTAPRRGLRTVPFTEFRAPVARAECAFEAAAPLPLLGTVKRQRSVMMERFVDWRRKVNGGLFTSGEFAAFAGGERVGHISNFLAQRALLKEIVRTGKDGRSVLWRFTDAKIGNQKPRGSK